MTLDVRVRVLVRCQHCLPREAKEGEELLEKLLPSGYTHLLCVNEPGDKEGDFRAHLKVQLSTEEEVERWLQDLQQSSSLTWRKARTYPQSGRYNAYRVDLRCHYKTYSTSKLSRNTNCPATLFLVLKRHMEERKSRSGDPHMAEGYFLHVNWRNEHNHQLVCADALSKRDVCDFTWVIIPDDWFKTLEIEQPREPESVLNEHRECSDGSAGTSPKITSDGEHPSNEEGESAGVTGTERLSTPEDSREFLEEQLDHIVGLLKNKLREDTTFTAPARSFVSNFHKLKTDSALQSALLCFGKTTSVASEVRAKPRRFLQTSAAKGVQATAVSRRKGPRKSCRREHPYSKQGRARVDGTNCPVVCRKTPHLEKHTSCHILTS